MSKLTLNDIPSGFFSNTAYNTNNGLIETALENTLSRDGTAPNTMGANLDMNSNRIINLPEPVSTHEAARLADIGAAVVASAAAVVSQAAALVSENNAAASESAAAASAAAALVSENNAAASYDSFDDRYLGAKAVAPIVDNDGNALLVGAFYWDTVSSVLFVWDGATWIDPVSGTSAGSISNTPAGNIAATDVQAAINELDTEKAKLAGDTAQAFATSTLTASSIVRGNSSTGTTTSSAVVGVASSSGTGVYGKSSTGYGIHGYGTGTNHAVLGENISTGAGVFGQSSSAGSGFGVYGNHIGTGAGVYGVCTSTGIGVYGYNSGTGHGVVAHADTTSPVASAFKIIPQDTEPTGPNAVGDIYVTTAGVLKICTVAGSPGTWVSVGAQV